MEDLIQIFAWLIFLLFILVQLALIILKKWVIVMFTSGIMTVYGALSMGIGLVSTLRIEIYGVLVLLVGLVLYISTKDRLERGEGFHVTKKEE
ncbi:hypothetical protein [Halobacillus amylolyticus]|uniref:Uncharacterized protein n=1 Tax=Halobacillus amylolyticus TaxID=2932259 RepID=A0ABY4H6Q5_9BACI|nr:hypothetical protein [Halobacillus amylolyticus]UOR10551.1 hypothetical protein MUO15_12790 [Halobacillus amylolyticus]